MTVIEAVQAAAVKTRIASISATDIYYKSKLLKHRARRLIPDISILALSLALYLRVSMNLVLPAGSQPTGSHNHLNRNKFFITNHEQFLANLHQRRALELFLKASQVNQKSKLSAPVAYFAERRASVSQAATSGRDGDTQSSPGSRHGRTLVCYYTSKGAHANPPKDAAEFVFPADSAGDGFTPVFHYDTIELANTHIQNNKPSTARRSQQMTFKPTDLLSSSGSPAGKSSVGANLKYLEPFSHLLSGTSAVGANYEGGHARLQASVPPVGSQIIAGPVAKQTASLLTQVYSMPFIPPTHYSFINELDPANNGPIVSPAHQQSSNRNNGNSQLASPSGPSSSQAKAVALSTKLEAYAANGKRNRQQVEKNSTLPATSPATVKPLQQVATTTAHNIQLVLSPQVGRQQFVGFNQALGANKDTLSLDTKSQAALASLSRPSGPRTAAALPYQQRIDTPANLVRAVSEPLVMQPQLQPALYQTSTQQLLMGSTGASHTHPVKTNAVGGNKLSTGSKLSPYLAQQTQRVSSIGSLNEPAELLEEASAGIEAQLSTKRLPSSPRPTTASQSAATSSSLLGSSTSSITSSSEVGAPLSSVSPSSATTLSSPLPLSMSASASPSSMTQSTPPSSAGQVSAAGGAASPTANQPTPSQATSLVPSPLSSMLDAFGMASQYFMRFKPSSFISPSSVFALNSNFPQSGQRDPHHFYRQSSAPTAGLSVSALPTLDSNNSNNSAQSASLVSGISSPNSLIPLSFPAALLAGVQKLTPTSDKAVVKPVSSGTANDRSSGGTSGFLARFTSAATAALSSSSSPGRDQQRREEVCGRTIQTPQRRIIGGEGARYGEFPYQVHIKIAKHQCGGALVDRQSIVTAAHCVYHFITRAPVSKLQIVIGAYDIEDEQYQELPPQYFKVNKVKLHPNFRFSASHPDRYDIAILKLDKPVKYTDNVLPVCLPSKDLKFENTVGTVTGFGKTDPSLSNRYGTRLLQKVDVPIIENNECERWHRTRGIDLKIFPEMMCAGYEDGLKDACVGDSGGPLVVKTSSGQDGSFRWTLAGITSAGFGCAQSRQPGIYHRVSHTVDWILENLD